MRGYLGKLAEAWRPLRRSNPVFALYWTGSTILFAVATLYFLAIPSLLAVVCLGLSVYSAGVLFGAAFFGKGSLANTRRALGALLRRRIP
jgi:hypothetical protein